MFPYGSLGVGNGNQLISEFSAISGLGRAPGEGNGNLLQCSYLENPMDRVA